jgi:O-antigen/teichoic acid export membrane protein
VQQHSTGEDFLLDATQPREAAGDQQMDATLPRASVREAARQKNTQRLIEQSIRGTQWIMVAIIVGVPLGFLTNVIIAHLGQAALGTYALVLIIVTAIQTFFLFGGVNVLVNFIPRATAREKSAFLLSYVGMAGVFSVIFFVAMVIFPRALQFILQQQHAVGPTIYLYLAIIIPVVICQTLTIAVLQGEMELPAAARTQYSVQTVSFALALAIVLFAVPHHLLPASTGVAGVVLGAYTISFLGGLVTLVRVMRTRWQFNARWYLPTNFWRFTTSVHFLTIAGFFFNSIDQLFILYYFHSTNQVGAFRPAIAVATYALWAPNLFTGAMYPLFTNLVAQKDFTTLKGAYRRYTAITGVVVAFFGLGTGLFAPQVLAIFGKGYGGTLPLMIVFAAMYTLLASASYVPTAALITAHEDVWINLIMYMVALGLRFGLYFPLVSGMGLLGVAAADAISMGALHIGTLVIVGLRYHVSVPLRQHFVSIVGGILLAVFYLVIPSAHTRTLVRVGEGLALLLVFAVILSQLRLISREDLRKVTARFKFLRRLGLG